MATKSPKSAQSHDAPPAKSPKSTVPKASPEPVTPAPEQSIHTLPKPVEKLSVTLRAESGYEYNLDLPRVLVEAIIDPDVADRFIEVPAISSSGQRLTNAKRFLHTAFVKEIDVRGL